MSPEEGGQFVKMLRTTFSTIAVRFHNNAPRHAAGYRCSKYNTVITCILAACVTCCRVTMASALVFGNAVCSAVLDAASIEWVWVCQ